MINKLLAIVVVGAILTSGMLLAYGHGIGYETLPPQMLGARQVAMEVSSTVDNSTNSKQIKFSMFDTTTGLTVRDVHYHIKTMKEGQTLFEGNYKTSNGVLTMSLIPNSADAVSVSEKKDSSVFGFLLGRDSSHIEAKGRIFEQNGLYKFSIDVLSAENYVAENDGRVHFESGLSFPVSASYALRDALDHQIRVMSYYDVVDELYYDKTSRAVSFTMPFEWSEDNIEQTMHVHEEVFVPKTLTEFQVQEYEILVNGVTLPNSSLTVDDYSNDHRIIHLLMYQDDLWELHKNQQNANTMKFHLSAKSDKIFLVDVTDNVQYRIVLTTDPARVVSGQDASILFQIYDVFLQNKLVAVDYNFSIRSDGKTLYTKSGKSSDVMDVWDEIRFSIPANVSNIMTVHFDNLGGNGFANAQIPIMVLEQRILVPSWIKQTAGWWCSKSITDDDFLRGIEYLIGNGVIQISEQAGSDQEKVVPDWVRNNSCWWAEGAINDGDFVNGLSYLVRYGIIVAS
jgi:hypothetical protein